MDQRPAFTLAAFADFRQFAQSMAEALPLGDPFQLPVVRGLGPGAGDRIFTADAAGRRGILSSDRTPVQVVFR
ncbi:hypothetical protein SDC9_189218 [bioreactor metagenome]|uniref:Uncharacterized protein n=1 Tax=bioreactor metagenome TaxID=1076179 RepID=A0A645HZT3_9ZZZZ